MDRQEYENAIADLYFALRMALYKLDGEFMVTQKESMEIPDSVHEDVIEIVEGPDYIVRFRGK